MLPIKNFVSIITASYNMGEYISKAIESVQEQTYPHYEHIIIDDGSQDGTKDIVADYLSDKRIFYYYQKNHGQTIAKNNGLRLAKGEYIAFLDADNLWLPNKLEIQVGRFQASGANVAVLHADIQAIDHIGKTLSRAGVKKHDGKAYYELLMNNFVCFNTAMVRKSVIDHVDCFDEKLTMGIDYDLWLRISIKYDLLYIPKILALYRIWGGQMSHKTEERIVNLHKIVNKFIRHNPGLLSKTQLMKIWGNFYTITSRQYIDLKKKRKAFNELIKAFQYYPFNIITWKTLVKLLLLRNKPE